MFVAEIRSQTLLALGITCCFTLMSCGPADQGQTPAMEEAAPVAAGELEGEPSTPLEESSTALGEPHEDLLELAAEEEVWPSETSEVEELAMAMQAQESEVPSLPDVATAPPERTYTVLRGDTLGSIAAAEYGDASRYREIFEANRDQLESPDSIAPGMVIVLP